jgi:hypothetical protein
MAVPVTNITVMELQYVFDAQYAFVLVQVRSAWMSLRD